MNLSLERYQERMKLLTGKGRNGNSIWRTCQNLLKLLRYCSSIFKSLFLFHFLIPDVVTVMKSQALVIVVLIFNYLLLLSYSVEPDLSYFSVCITRAITSFF